MSELIASTYAQDRLLTATYRKNGNPDSPHTQFDTAMWSHRHTTSATEPGEDRHEERIAIFTDLYPP